MAEHLTLARPYAKAAFEFAVAAGQLEQWQKMLATLSVAAQDTNVTTWLSVPNRTNQQIVDGLADIAGDAMAANGKNFLVQLADNKRLTLLPEIYQLFEQWLLEHQQRVDVVVESAFELTTEQIRKIADAMKKRLGKEVSIIPEVNADLIGGVKIQAGDLVIDDSIKARLNRLADSLQVSV